MSRAQYTSGRAAYSRQATGEGAQGGTQRVARGTASTVPSRTQSSHPGVGGATRVARTPTGNTPLGGAYKGTTRTARTAGNNDPAAPTRTTRVGGAGRVARQPGSTAPQRVTGTTGAQRVAGPNGTQRVVGTSGAQRIAGSTAPQRVARSAHTGTHKGPVPNRDSSAQLPPQRTTSMMSGAGNVMPFRESGNFTAKPPRDAAVLRARRVSKIIVEKEKKTSYWQEVITEAKVGSNVSQDDLNAIIGRAMTLNLVGNWKQRENTTPPTARELFGNMETVMIQKIKLFNGNKPVQVQGVGIEKVRNLEAVLSQLETNAEKKNEKQEEMYKNKVGELSSVLQTLEKKKQESENKRKTISLEISNLKDEMSKAGLAEANSQSQNQLTEKMSRLEAAMRLMNDERKRETEREKETELLKKKLSLFESKMAEISNQKRVHQAEDHGDALKEKLLLMEEKLQKMERRKSVSITMMMQDKMNKVENELTALRVQGGGGGNRINDLERKLMELQNQKTFTPDMVNDDETNALRAHVGKLEEAMRNADRKMEEEKIRAEEERMRNWKKRKEEEDEFRRRAQQREQMLFAKVEALSKMAASNRGGGPPPPPPMGGGGGGGASAALLNRLAELEAKLSSQVTANPLEAKLKEMEAKLAAATANSNSSADMIKNALAQAGGDSSEMAKDLKIAMLEASHAELIKRLDANQAQMEDKFTAMDNKVRNMVVAGPGANTHCSGLSYAEINAKMAEIQAKLFDENTPEKEGEALNIEYEKLISEMEMCPEYIAELQAEVQKWKDENEPLNEKALQEVRQKLGSMNTNQRNQLLQRKPELKFLGFTHDVIMKKHVNDFKGITTQNLDESEARALYCCMPKFRKEQEKQLEFVEQLKNKIEIEVKKPKKKPPPPIQAKRKVVFKRPPPGGGGGGGSSFLDELMKKRKQID